MQPSGANDDDAVYELSLQTHVAWLPIGGNVLYLALARTRITNHFLFFFVFERVVYIGKDPKSL